MAVTRENLINGGYYRLISGLGSSKTFTAGTVVKIEISSRHSGVDNWLGKSEYKTLEGKDYRGYDYLYLDNLEPLTETEVKLMNKPATFIINVVGSATFHKTTEQQKDKQIAALLTANPTIEVAVYTLAGVATTKPVEVEFTFASEILK